MDPNDTFFPVAMVKNTVGRYVDSAFAIDYYDKAGDGKVFVVKGLPRGLYTVEMVSNEDGGDYKMAMKCSMNNTDNDTDKKTKITEYEGIYEYKLRFKLCTFCRHKMAYILRLYVYTKWSSKGQEDTMDVFCEDISSGFIIGNETISFRFNVDHQQDVSFVDTDNTFFPILKLKDSVGRYVANEIATDCNEWECDGMSFTIKSLSRGMYTVQLLPVPNGGNATNFKVNMICSNGSSSGITGTVRFKSL